jgi:hypothetical protein
MLNDCNRSEAVRETGFHGQRDVQENHMRFRPFVPRLT